MRKARRKERSPTKKKERKRRKECRISSLAFPFPLGLLVFASYYYFSSRLPSTHFTAAGFSGYDNPLSF
jgi:hypothetical protein